MLYIPKDGHNPWTSIDLCRGRGKKGADRGRFLKNAIAKEGNGVETRDALRGREGGRDTCRKAIEEGPLKSHPSTKRESAQGKSKKEEKEVLMGQKKNAFPARRVSMPIGRKGVRGSCLLEERLTTRKERKTVGGRKDSLSKTYQKRESIT